MDKNRILGLLRDTSNVDSKVREPAEQQLNTIHKIIGFCPALLEIVLHQELELPVRQAAVIYLKNNIIKFWENRNALADKAQPDPYAFYIHEQDRKLITDSIVDAIVNCGHELITVHLSSIVNIIIKTDFPHKWPGVVDKIHYYLVQTNDFNAWSGSLMTFYQLAKIYEYRNQNERKPFLEALKILLPAACQRLEQLLQTDPMGDLSCKLQKQILKTFHATLQYSLPLSIITHDTFTQWMRLIIEIAKRDIPDTLQADIDKEDRPDLIWWKCKKWSLHLLARIFERYGSPNNVNNEYKAFAQWYIGTFSMPVIQTIIRILELYATGHYISPRVMQQSLNYLNTAVLHSMTWKMLKNDMMVVVEKIIFPLMSHSEEDEDLWQNDPREYIRMKYDIFEEYVSPVSASQTLLQSLCKKRKDMLQNTMTLVVNVLNNPQADAKAKDGVLHMVGSIGNVLIKKPVYKDQLEQLVTNYVFPLFSSPHGFLRARACWTLNYFASLEFKDISNIATATQAVMHCILNDTQLPVKVEAGLCLQNLLHCQPTSKAFVQPSVKILVQELVQMIRSTESEDVMEVLQKIVYLFPEDIYIIAVDMTNHLAETFHQLIATTETEEDEKISAAMSILSTIDTVLTMMDEKKEIVVKLEPIVVNIILKIFEQNTQELYEEATTLLSTITADTITDETWRVFQTIYVVFKRDGVDYFTDLMSPIHNYITVDPERFIQSESNIGAIFDMCHSIMSDQNANEEIESYAAKLLELVILQFGKRINFNYLYSMIELVILRLRRNIDTTELRTLLLQIVIAVLYVDFTYLFSFFEKLELQHQHAPHTLFNSFLKQWLADVPDLRGIHDRKLGIIGFCTLMRLPKVNRPPMLYESSKELIPASLMLCERLRVAYHTKANLDSDTESEDDLSYEDSEEELEILEDDQDHVGHRAHEADDDDDFEDIQDDEGDSETDDYDDSNSDDEEQTALESFETLIDMEKGFIDEFILFKQTLEFLHANDQEWYQLLAGSLNNSQQKKLMDLKDVSVQSLTTQNSKNNNTNHTNNNNNNSNNNNINTAPGNVH